MIADGVDETPDGNGWFVGRLNAGVPVPVGRRGSLAPGSSLRISHG
jgi:hypothetical protein